MPTVAVIGASANRAKFGNKAVRAFRDQGYDVYPVNPSEAEIEGLRAYPSILEVPGKLDEVTVYVSPERGMLVIEDIAKKGCGKVWLNPGAESRELIAKGRELKLNVVAACSIVGIGTSPAAYP